MTHGNPDSAARKAREQEERGRIAREVKGSMAPTVFSREHKGPPFPEKTLLEVMAMPGGEEIEDAEERRFAKSDKMLAAEKYLRQLVARVRFATEKHDLSDSYTWPKELELAIKTFLKHDLVTEDWIQTLLKGEIEAGEESPKKAVNE